MKNLRVFSSVLAAAMLAPLSAAVFTQARPSGDTVSLSFRALTPAGSPVTDLNATEVVLKVGGKERAIRSFERLRLGDAPVGGPDTPPAFATNAIPATGLRDTLVVIDDQSIPPGEERRVATAMTQYLAALGPSDRVGIAFVQDRGLNTLMTNDRDKINAALKGLVGRAPAAETADEATCRTRRVIDALISVSSTTPPSATPVTVLLFSSGVSAPATTTTMSKKGGFNDPPPSACEVTTREFQALGRAVAGSAMNLYVVAAALSTSTEMQQGIENLAGASGNPLMELVKGGDSDLSRIARENTAWYRVTFTAEPNERTGELQRVEVQSKRAGVEARTRSQVLMPRPAASSQPAVAKDMLRVPRVHRDLELRASAFMSKEAGSEKVKVVVLFEPSDAGVALKSASVGLFDPSGKLTVQGSADAASLAHSPATMAVLANPGKYRLRLAAVDADNRGGTVDMDVDVALGVASTMQLGSLILGVADGGSFAGRVQFAAEPAAIGYLEIYGVPAAGQVSATLELAASETGPALVSFPAKVLGEGPSRVATSGVSIAQMPPGDVVFRMVVNVDGKPVGSSSHTMHKVAK